MRKKMSFWMSVFMALGCIIGAGVFARTPLVIRLVREGLVWGFILAAVFVFLKTIPEVLLSSTLPANGGAYMHLTRLVHPKLGMIHAYNQLVLGTMNIAIMSLTFSVYFKIIVPSINGKIVAIFVALFFTVISTFGVKVSGWVQNVAVVILLSALGLFVVKGLPGVQLSPAAVLRPDITLGELWAAMGLLHGSLMGANVLFYAADEVENPRRTIPIAFVMATLLSAVFFSLVGFVSIGTILPGEWLANWDLNLGSVAQQFLSSRLLLFFIVAGPLLAVSTSINAMILMFSRAHFAAARDGLFPKWISKLNKYGVPANSIWFNSAIGIAAILLGFGLDAVLKLVAVPGLLLAPVIFYSVFKVPKRYPLSYKNNILRIPPNVAKGIVVVASLLSWLLGYGVVSRMEPKSWVAMIVFYSLAFGYSIYRRKSLKEQGIDLYENMTETYQPWEDHENSLMDKVI